MATRVALRSAQYPAEFLAWSHWLKEQDIAGLRQVNPSLLIKPLRPYMAADWAVPRRIEALMATIDCMKQQDGIFNEFVAGRSVVLGALALRAFPDVSIVIAPTPNKEGELTLSLHVAGFPNYVARAIFAFDKEPEGAIALRIGCVQGNRRAYELDRNLEKAMSGLRPKALTVFALQELAHALGVKDIFGVNNARQVFARKHALAKHLGMKVLTLQMDYDSLWHELGGTAQADGWFRLPPRYVRRAPEQMKPNKRSMYKKRYELLDQVSVLIENKLVAHVQPAAAQQPIRAAHS